MKETKCIILGDPVKPSSLKKIVFDRILCTEGNMIKHTMSEPSAWGTIELVSKGYSDKFDVMFAYDADGRKAGVLIIGQWNDGVV